MKIPTKNILEFQKLSNEIRTESILPILSYVLLDIKDNMASLVKSNLHSSCKYTFPLEHEDYSMLLDSKLFFECANRCKDTLEIIPTDTKVQMRHDTGETFFDYKGMSIADFPKQHEPTNNYDFAFTHEILQSINSASSLASKGQEILRYVYSNENDIYTQDGFSMYFKQFSGNMPKLNLSTKECAVLSDGMTYSDNDNWNFYTKNNLQYSFKKSEVESKRYQPIFANIKKHNGIRLDKEQLERFCQTVKRIAANVPKTCLLHNDTLSFNSPELNISHTEALDVPLDVSIEPFSFDAEILLHCVQPLPYDYLWAIVDKQKIVFYNEDDLGYCGISMGLTITNQ